MEETRYVSLKQLERDQDRREYEKPIIELQETMTFPLDGLIKKTKELGTKLSCRQCSSCHNCR